MKRAGRQSGITLIELLIGITVLGLALSSTLAATTAYLGHSTTPAIRQQAQAIAEAYLEEILLQPYDDPDGGDSGSCEEAGRELYDDINDYACVDDQAGARDHSGSIIAGLEGYNVRVAIGAGSLNGAAGRHIEVSVGHDALGSQNIRISAWRVAMP